MTRLQEINGDLEVISGSAEEQRFKRGVEGPLVTKDGVALMLRRLKVDGGRPVLLLHGASAGADTFLTPRGARKDQPSLVDYLVIEGFEPWLLDWRGSKDVTDSILQRDDEDPLSDSKLVDFNKAAKYDIAAALDVIEYIKKKEQKKGAKSEDDEPLHIDAIGFCMGGAILAEALLKDSLPKESLLEELRPIRGRLSHVVLMTIGLFYQMNVHGRLKAEAHLLKRVISEDSNQRFIDPRINKKNEELPPARVWPEFVETLYQLWRHPYDEARMDRENIPKEDRHALQMFNRVSFMLGEPYHETNLVPEIQNRLTIIRFKAGDNIGSLSVGTLIEAKFDPADNTGSLSAGPLIEAKDEDHIVARGELAYPYRADAPPDVEGFSKLVLCRCYRTEEQKRYLDQQEPPLLEQKSPLFWKGLSLLADGQSIGTVHGKLDYQEPLLPELFGAMPVHLFMHGAENLRAGIATDLKGNGEDEKTGKEQQDTTPAPVLDAFEDSDADPYEGFKALDHLTLIGGGLNRLWHRDSIDRMGAWLERNPWMRNRWTKHMLLDYGHQDLLWGRNAPEDVFPEILKGLGEPHIKPKVEDLDQSAPDSKSELSA